MSKAGILFVTIQLKIYFDVTATQLCVTVVSASGLTPRSDGSPRCPYAKIFLLPDKSEKSKRRTKTLANTLEPRWNQNFIYCGIRITDVKRRTLEVITYLCMNRNTYLYKRLEFNTTSALILLFGIQFYLHSFIKMALTLITRNVVKIQPMNLELSPVKDNYYVCICIGMLLLN